MPQPPWATNSSASWYSQGSGVFFLKSSLNFSALRRYHHLLPAQKAVLERPCPLTSPQALGCAVRCHNAFSAPCWTSPSPTDPLCLRWASLVCQPFSRTPKRTYCLHEAWWVLSRWDHPCAFWLEEKIRRKPTRVSQVLPVTPVEGNREAERAGEQGEPVGLSSAASQGGTRCYWVNPLAIWAWRCLSRT